MLGNFVFYLFHRKQILEKSPSHRINSLLMELVKVGMSMGRILNSDHARNFLQCEWVTLSTMVILSGQFFHDHPTFTAIFLGSNLFKNV